MGITIKIGGIDRTEYVDARSLSVIDELTSKINTASFLFICNDPALAPEPGQAVLIEEGVIKLFSGRILNNNEDFLPPNLLKYDVNCIDYTRDLDRRLVAESYVDQKAGDIIKDIIAKYTLTDMTETLRPNAIGFETNIPGQIPDSGEHWQKVDEPVPDDDDYVINLTEDEIYYRDLYALSDPTPTAGKINKITAYFRAKSDSDGRIKPSLKSNGIVTDGVAIDLINAWVNYSQEWATNPADGEAWDWPDLASLQMGISLQDFEAGCFTRDTRITLSDGSYKEVKDIRSGDKVNYYDFVEHKIKSTIVTKINEHPVNEMGPYYLILNKKLKVTRNHPLDKLNGKMIIAGKVKVGDFLQGESGSIEIFSIEKVWKRVKTYSLETGSKHYFIDGFSDMSKPCTYCSQVYVEIDYTPPGGVTTNNVADGPTINEIAFDFVQVSEAITKIAEICGYEWYLDYDRDIHFFFRTDFPAPFQLDDDQENYKDLVISRDISQIRNRIYIKSSAIKDTFGEVFIADGVTTSWTCKYRTEIMLPEKVDTDTLRWGGNAVEFSHNDVYLAVGLDWVLGMPNCPDIRIYKRDGDTFTKISDPDVLPTGNAYGVAWSSDDVYLAVGHQVSPYITIYKRDGDVFIKLDNPETLPTGNGNGLDFGYDDTYLAIAHYNSPYITIYKRTVDAFLKLDDPGDLPTGTGYDAAFSPDGVYLAVVHATTPFITIYKRTGDTFTKLANPASLPTGDGLDVAFSPDGIYLAVGHKITPFITIYKRSGDTFTKLDDPADLPTGYVTGVAFAPNTTHLVTSHENSPYVTLYKRGADIFVKVDDPSPLPTGDGLSAAFSYNNRYIAIGHSTSPRLTIYKHFVPLIMIDGVYKTVGWDGIDNPLYFDYMLNPDTKVLSLGTYTSTPATGVELFIIYTVLGAPICFRRDDEASIIDRQEKEGGDGIIEFCIVDNNIDSIEWANEAAKADLLQNAYPTIRATFATNRSDIKSGQIITLSSTKRDISQDFLIQKVELIRVDVIAGEYPTISYKPAATATIGYLPADEAVIPYRKVEGGVIYYLFNGTISTAGVRKLEDLFLHILSKVEE